MHHRNYFVPGLLFLLILVTGCKTAPSVPTEPVPNSVSESKKQTVLFSGSSLIFELPSDKWSLIDKREMNDRSLYAYGRTAVVDKAGRKIVPTFAVICESVAPNQDLTVYSILKRNNARFAVKKLFTHESGEVKIRNALGYVGNYTDSRGLEHTILVVHAINKNAAYQISLDVTSEIYPEVQEEFYSILKSLSFLN